MLRRIAIYLGAGFLPVLLLGGFGILFYETTNDTLVGGEEVSYLSGEANIRSCPSVECASSGLYSPGQQVTVVGRAKSDTDQEWSEVKYGDSTRFIRSDYLKPSSATIAGIFESLFVLGTAFSMLLITLWTGSERLQDTAARHPRIFDASIISVTLGAGIVSCGIGYFFARAEGASPSSFLSDSFINLGAGFAGAAVTFALFQSLLSRRNSSAEQVEGIDGRIARLEHKVVCVDAKIEDVSDTIDRIETRQRQGQNRRSPNFPQRRSNPNSGNRRTNPSQ
ncbi:SH3 domain-containing protein [Nocardia sp. NPDC051787]|uniref:SH3 domain-containing protein n=1 Tax=Nocardia sp. NPDC051787 TaxID=3155415 RepID=UPI00342E6F7B